MCNPPIAERYPKARKEHTCDICKRTIRIGRHYYAVVFYGNNKVFTNKACTVHSDRTIQESFPL